MARVTVDGDLDGDLVEHPRHSRKAERTLQKAPQCVSRRTEGGTCRTKAMQLLAKAHQHVKWQREGFHQKTALAHVRQYDAIYVEAIQPAALRRRPAPKPCAEAGWRRGRRSQRGRPEGRPQHRDAGRRVGPVPLNPRLHGSMGRQASGSGLLGLYHAGR